MVGNHGWRLEDSLFSEIYRFHCEISNFQFVAGSASYSSFVHLAFPHHPPHQHDNPDTMEEVSKQKFHQSIIAQIPDSIKNLFDTLGCSTPARILDDTPNSLLDPNDYLASIHPFVSRIEDSLNEYHPNVQMRFLAVTIYPGRHSVLCSRCQQCRLRLGNCSYQYGSDTGLCFAPVGETKNFQTATVR